MNAVNKMLESSCGEWDGNRPSNGPKRPYNISVGVIIDIDDMPKNHTENCVENDIGCVKECLERGRHEYS